MGDFRFVTKIRKNVFIVLFYTTNPKFNAKNGVKKNGSNTNGAGITGPNTTVLKKNGLKKNGVKPNETKKSLLTNG